MPSGAVHPNTSNFPRCLRLNVVERVRKLVAQGAYETRPEWLQFAERAPPMELENLKLRDIRITNPYPAMVQYVLRKYPDMRFQDCFVDGNDWTKGNDRYRDDHPVMQFVARQLQLMNSEGLSKKEAFQRTHEEYMVRRRQLEARQKVEMAMALNQRLLPAFTSPDRVNPLFTTGAGVTRQREAQLEVEHLNHIRRKLRMLRKEIEPHDKRRMNAKEMALDMELERTSLLPRMTPSQYKPPLEQKLVNESIPTQQHVAHPKRDYFEDMDDVEEVSEEQELEDEGIAMHGLDEWEPPLPITSAPLVKPEEPKNVFRKDDVKPVVAEPKPPSFDIPKPPERPHWAQARPDKISLQSIMARRRKEEVEKKIGKEPGDTEPLDFEDFMNLVRKKNQK